ncbi:MAG TPA: glycosyltransferase family 2 protein [Rubrobacter sp.]|nr:glycosyltransferase family 2 protein [Rubrobacter sp.]
MARSVSIVVAARDEAPTLRRALPTLLAQDYPSMQLIVVDDRSSDATRQTVEALFGEHSPGRHEGAPATEVHRIDRLPEGWIGKSHALYEGAKRATGEWIIFTDADVCFDPTTVRRAVEYAERESLDHLALVPKLDLDAYWLRCAASFFYLGYMITLGMYRANLPAARSGLGIGAFNLLRRPAYQAMGTYAALRMSPADDYSLGEAVKRAGLSQRLLTGVGEPGGPPLVHLKWYGSLGGFFRGIEKNVLPICGYNPFKVVGIVLSVQLTGVVPFLALLSRLVRSKPSALGAFALAAALNLLSFALFSRWQRYPKALRMSAGYPIHVVVSCYALLRAVVVVLAAGGITWRETFYPLAELRAAQAARGREEVGS